MVTSELETVWITSDGKKFLSKKEAKIHELDIYDGEIVDIWAKQTNQNKEKPTWLERLRLKRK